jgi:hypothetical protein
MTLLLLACTFVWVALAAITVAHDRNRTAHRPA